MSSSTHNNSLHAAVVRNEHGKASTEKAPHFCGPDFAKTIHELETIGNRVVMRYYVLSEGCIFNDASDVQNFFNMSWTPWETTAYETWSGDVRGGILDTIPTPEKRKQHVVCCVPFWEESKKFLEKYPFDETESMPQPAPTKTGQKSEAKIDKAWFNNQEGGWVTSAIKVWVKEDQGFFDIVKEKLTRDMRYVVANIIFVKAKPKFGGSE